MAGLHIETKREFHPIRWLVVLFLLGLVAASAWFAYRWYTTGEEPPFPIPIAKADTRVDESNVTSQQIDQYTVPQSHPRYISIPSLGIEKVRVMSVGITSNNELDTPRNINDTAWYTKSSTPGQGYGAVLIDGHNGGVSKDGVFSKLSTLPKGAVVTVERGDGVKFSYRIVSNVSMSLDDVNNGGMKVMMQSAEADKEGLSLITCDGKWVPRYQQFDRRIMVRAVRIDQ